MAAKDSRHTGHCRSGEAGAEVLGVTTWELLEVEMVLVVLVVEETEMVGEAVSRSFDNDVVDQKF